eukprot:CCRYP_010753-RB/>CCRYP_010753-RB protein AED:0.04 eAED:0.04 QI:112/1/1/1/0/0/3/31/98
MTTRKQATPSLPLSNTLPYPLPSSMCQSFTLTNGMIHQRGQPIRQHNKLPPNQLQLRIQHHPHGLYPPPLHLHPPHRQGTIVSFDGGPSHEDGARFAS